MKTTKPTPTSKVKVGDVVKAYHEKDDCVVEGTVSEILSDYAFVMEPNKGYNGIKIAFLFEDIVK
jgi:hypothetical protein